MEIQKVLVHYCFQRKKGLEKDTPLSPKKCRCRQFVTVAEAEIFIKEGMAQHVVLLEKPYETDELCSTCMGDEKLKKTCTHCKMTGQVRVTKFVKILGPDIIFISQDGRRNTKTTQVKKSPTIERAHIERAYCHGDKKHELKRAQEERARIEIYGELNREFFHSLTVGFEPPDDPRTGTGRKFDYGRSI